MGIFDRGATPCGPAQRVFRPLPQRNAYPGRAETGRLLGRLLQLAPDARRLLAVNIYPAGHGGAIVWGAALLDVRENAAAAFAAASAWASALSPAAIIPADPDADYWLVIGALTGSAAPVTVHLTSVEHSGHRHFDQFDPPPIAPGPLSSEQLAGVYQRAADAADAENGEPDARRLINAAVHGGSPDRDHLQALTTFALSTCVPPGTLELPADADAAALLERWRENRQAIRDAIGAPVTASIGKSLRTVASAMLNPVHLRQSRPVHPGFGVTAPTADRWRQA